MAVGLLDGDTDGLSLGIGDVGAVVGVVGTPVGASVHPACCREQPPPSGCRFTEAIGSKEPNPNSLDFSTAILRSLLVWPAALYVWTKIAAPALTECAGKYAWARHLFPAAGDERMTNVGE